MKRDLLIQQLAAAAGLEIQGNDLAKLLTALSFWMMGDLDVAKFKKDIVRWHELLAPMYDQLKMNKASRANMDKLVASMLSGRPPSQDDETTMETVGQFFQVVDPRLDAMTEIKRVTLKFIRLNIRFFRTGNNPAYQALLKGATDIHEKFGRDVIDEDIPSQLTDAHTLIDTIEKLTGRRDIKLTEEEKERFRVEKPDEYQTILASRKAILNVAKMFVRGLIRKAGGRLLYSELLAELTANYIIHDWPKAQDWDGYVDEAGVLYTLAKKEIKGKPGFVIVGNPEYNPKTDDTFVFHCVTSMGNKQYFYTNEALAGWKGDRFEAVDDFVPMVEKVRAGWLHDLKGTKHKTKVLAAVCELVYWASARIGAMKNNVRGERTFGISTLQGRHITREGSNLIVDYMGKMNHRQKHVLTPKTPEQKLLARLLLDWAEAAGEDGAVFDLTEGAHATPVTGSTVNTYFKSKGANVTIHKLRHARATIIMDRLLRDKKNCPYFRYKADGSRELIQARKPTQSEAEALYKDLATEVGRELGHTSGEKVTPMTAINAYVNPSMTLAFFADLKLRTPSWAEKFAAD